MVSEVTDTAFYYVKASLVNLCSNTIANLDFSKHNKFDQQWLDSYYMPNLYLYVVVINHILMR